MNSKIKKQIFGLMLIFSIFIFSFNFVIAAATATTTPNNLQKATEELTTFGAKAGFSATKSIDSIVGETIKYILSFLGVVFLCLLVYGGFIWMLAKGDSEEVKKSKDIMTNAIIGLGIVLGAYMITAWIVSGLARSTIERLPSPNPSPPPTLIEA